MNIIKNLRLALVFAFVALTGFLLSAESSADSTKAYIDAQAASEEKVENLLQLSRDLYDTDLDNSITVSEQAIRLSRKLDYLNGVAYGLKSVGIAYYYKGDFVEAVTAWQKSLAVFDSIGDKIGVSNILTNIGAIYQAESDYSTALDYHLRALKAAEETKDTLRIVTVLINIGAVYLDNNSTHDKALDYSLRALALSEAINEYDAISTSAVNIGALYLEKKDNEKALEYFQKSLDASQTEDNRIYSMISIGNVYRAMGQYQESLNTLNRALRLARGLNLKPTQASALLALAQTHEAMNEIDRALENFKQAAAIARELNAWKRLEYAYKGLKLIYFHKEKYDSAYHYQNLYMAAKDSIYDTETDKLLKNQMFNFQIEKKQDQINHLQKEQALIEKDIRNQKIINGLVGAGLVSVAIFLFVALSQKKRISKEKDRSESLLLNILPYEIAEELKEKGESDARHFDEATVLFTDFKGFTGLSQILSPQELVMVINDYFKTFDAIVTKYGIEKIKTIGDAYMAAGGLPVPNEEALKNVILAGLEMQEFVKNRQATSENEHYRMFSMRLGIHTGPVVAGIVGVKKFQYDIWGDTVNTAARMESSGAVGEVNISGATYKCVKDLPEFEFEYRGMVEAKGKGEMEMYFVRLKDQQNKGEPDLVEGTAN